MHEQRPDSPDDGTMRGTRYGCVGVALLRRPKVAGGRTARGWGLYGAWRLQYLAKARVSEVFWAIWAS
ncbi:hypothetical protein V6Z11_A10G187100 [Gossypium hirsutum]